jgi:hypothetical protein
VHVSARSDKGRNEQDGSGKGNKSNKSNKSDLINKEANKG